MKILVINSGSSSLKFKLFDGDLDSVIAGGIMERIGLEKGRMTYFGKAHGSNISYDIRIPDHRSALQLFLTTLTDAENGALSSFSEISAVGHRVVHGADKFTGSVLIDKRVIEAIEECSQMAPLHNPPNLSGIRAAMESLPDVPNIAVFDTSFHQTLPPKAFIFPLPYEIYSQMGIRKYGFHGTSHKYVSEKTAEFMKKPPGQLDLITCHLGNGSSIAAIKGGKSVDTSLGFGTMCGVMMGTRPGDFDPAVLIELLENRSMTIQGLKEILYNRSGMLGISGVSSDIRDIEKSAGAGNERSRLSLELFSESVRKYIGAYATVLGRLDAIVFTGGIGENSCGIRENICRGLEVLGAELDPEKNISGTGLSAISSDESKILILVVPTNEELMIALETMRILSA